MMQETVLYQISFIKTLLNLPCKPWEKNKSADNKLAYKQQNESMA